MSNAAARQLQRQAIQTQQTVPSAISANDILQYGKQVVAAEAKALDQLAEKLGSDFCRASKLLFSTTGNVIVTGMGKAGLVGQKIAATLASTGTKAFFLHPAEAIHGDLGRVDASDVVLLLSQSGATAEVVALLPSLKLLGAKIITITGKPNSEAGRAADFVLDTGVREEVCPLGLAPSTSTTAMLAMGDALSIVLSRMKNFRAEDFAKFHPGGSLGKQLSSVEEQMRPLTECRLASETQSVREVLVECSKPGRRSGAIMLTNAAGQLTGMFTDSDLARLFEHRQESALDGPIHNVMAHNPLSATVGTRLPEAIETMAERKISELPVLNENAEPIGMLDITDIVGRPELAEPEQPASSSSSPPQTVRIFNGSTNAG